jgi:hypothetical protein
MAGLVSFWPVMLPLPSVLVLADVEERVRVGGTRQSEESSVLSLATVFLWLFSGLRGFGNVYKAGACALRLV